MKAPKSAVDYLNDGASRSVPLESERARLTFRSRSSSPTGSRPASSLPGDVLPTERELTRQLGVSRMTVRAAMDRLVQRDLIVRRQGSGTFVADPKLRQDASKLRGFFEDTVGQGVTPISRLLEREEMLATRHLAGVLDVSVGESVYRIVRVRSARGMPVVLETSYFPAAIVPGLLGMDLERSSIYRLMDMEFSARPVRARQSLEVATAHGTDASFLEIPSGSSVMLVERVSWDALGRAVEYARDLYRPGPEPIRDGAHALGGSTRGQTRSRTRTTAATSLPRMPSTPCETLRLDAFVVHDVPDPDGDAGLVERCDGRLRDRRVMHDDRGSKRAGQLRRRVRVHGNLRVDVRDDVDLGQDLARRRERLVVETIEERPVRAASAANELRDRNRRGCRISGGGTFDVDAYRDTAVAAKVQDGFQAGDP